MLINSKLIKISLLCMCYIFFISAVPTDNLKSSQITINADKAMYLGGEKKTVLEGNVVVFNDEFTLTSNTIDIYRSSEEIDKIICYGNVNFKTKDVISVSKNAELSQKDKIIILSGGVKVWQGDNVLEGEKVTMYYEEDRIIVDKGSQKRVTIIFNPESKENPFESGSKKP